jgi:hypothetical protein
LGLQDSRPPLVSLWSALAAASSIASVGQIA